MNVCGLLSCNGRGWQVLMVADVRGPGLLAGRRPCRMSRGTLRRICGKSHAASTCAQVKGVAADICKTAGMRLRWFEPNTCHTKPQVKAGDAELRHRLLRAKGAVHRAVGCVPWAMRGPDPAVGWLRLRSV